MARSVKSTCEGIIRVGNFCVFRRVGQRLKRADGLPVFIAGQINVGDERIVTGQILPNELQLLSRGDLSGIFSCAVFACKAVVGNGGYG